MLGDDGQQHACRCVRPCPALLPVTQWEVEAEAATPAATANVEMIKEKKDQPAGAAASAAGAKAPAAAAKAPAAGKK